jgi:glycosyltransferase involved in cell wall biosynthesis
VVHLKDALRHVLLVTDAFYPDIGGVERVCLELARSFTKLGLRITVLARRTQNAPESETIDGVKILRHSPAARPTPYAYLSHYLSVRRSVASLLSSDPPDIAHLHLSLSAQGAIGPLHRSHKPIVASFYGPWHAEYRVEAEDLYQTRGAAYGFYLDALIAAQKAMQRRMIRSADGVVVLSDYSRGELLDLCPGAERKIVKIPGGIDPKIFSAGERRGIAEKFGLDPSLPTVFTARRLVRRMGVDMALDALALLARRGRFINFIIAGRGSYRSALEKQAADLGIADRTRFIGFVSDEDLAALYRGCDLFLLPTRAQENFGLPILEAAACACPVLATPVGSIPEVMSEAGQPYLCEKADAQSIATKIEKAFAILPSDAQTRADNALRVVREFSWDAIAALHVEHYREVIRCASR